MTDIPAIFERYRVPCKKPGEHHHAARWHQVDCPFCSPNSGRFRLGFSPSGAVAACWTCGRHPPVDALALLTGESWGKCKELLGSIVEHEPEAAPRGKLVVPEGVRDMLPVHRDYLAGRGIDPDAAASLWGIRGIGHDSRLAWRLFIPIELHGKVVSWTTRAIGEGMRYVNARPEEEAVAAKGLLFGEGMAGHAIIVVEGPLDAVRIGPGAVATMGLQVTRRQAARIARHAKRVVCFDAEPEAQRRAEHLCCDLAAFPGETLRAEISSGKDPGEASERELNELRRLIA